MTRLKFATSVALSLLMLATSAYGADIAVGPFSIALPRAFIGPIRATPDANSETIAYSSVPTQGQPAANVIQFTRYAIGAAPPNTDSNGYAEAAEHYLQQMLQGVERKRTDYVQSPVKRIRLVGHVGTRATWTGKLQGAPLNGVMYCAIIGTDVWFIHVFGAGNRPDVELQAVIAAVEHGGH